MPAALSVTLLAVAGRGCSSESVTLDGTSWRLRRLVAELDEPGRSAVAAQFADGKISGKSAVDDCMGPYTQGPGDAFSVGDLAGTMMAADRVAARRAPTSSCSPRQSRMS